MGIHNNPVIDYLKHEEIYNLFKDVFIYDGDDNCSCNDEYTLDANECIISNGLQNTIIQKINSENGVQNNTLVTSIRGATFVIIVSFHDDGNYDLDLRIDRSYYINAIQEVKRTLSRIRRNDGFNYMNYHLKRNKRI